MTNSEFVSKEAKKWKSPFDVHIVTQMATKPLDIFSLGSYVEL